MALGTRDQSGRDKSCFFADKFAIDLLAGEDNMHAGKGGPGFGAKTLKGNGKADG